MPKNAPEILSRVERLIDTYQGNRCLYLHRCKMIVQCLNWDITDEHVRSTIQLEQMVIGRDWSLRTWDFSVRWDDINQFKLEHQMLSGCQMRDTIVFNATLVDAALSVHPNSEESVQSALLERISSAMWA